MHEDAPVEKTDSIQHVIPLHAEQIDVTRLTRETGQVKVSTVTHLREQIVDEVLAEHHAHVSRVAIGRIIETLPDVRQEGDTTIIPVVEEVLVIEKKLFLKQEIHITRVRTTSHHQETVVLRHQEAIVSRTASGDLRQDAPVSTNIQGDKDG